MHRRLRTIIDNLGELRARIPHAGASAGGVSAWSVGQQIDHAVRTDRAILGYMPPDHAHAPVAHGLTPIGRMALLTGWIPRGRGRSPERLYPQPVDAATLAAQIDALVVDVGGLDPQLPAIRRRPERYAHPVFGGLDRWQWLGFIALHQRHHLKIIRDIVRAQER